MAEHLDTEHRKEETDDHGGPLTTEYIQYAIMDTQVTWECYIKLRERYALHGLNTTALQKVFSGAGLGKAYLEEMGIKSWRDCQSDFPPKLLGIIMSSYFGGRSEVRIRQEATQVAYCDFLSMYPTVCTLSPDELETYQRSLSQYHLHPENKFLDGGYSDRGLTRRRHIFAFEIRSIGKEANRLEEQEELEPREEYQIEYGTSPEDYARFAGKLKELIKRHDLRAVALMARISERQLSSIVKGKAFPQTNTRKNLLIAFSYLEKEAAASVRQTSEMLSWLNEAFTGLSIEEQKLFAKQVGSTPSNIRQMLKRERNISPKVMAAHSAHRRTE